MRAPGHLAAGAAMTVRSDRGEAPTGPASPLDVEALAAELYDPSVPDWPGEIPFYRSLSARASSLLEVACGTGRVALQLARRGLRIFGLDASSPMLDVARRKSGADRRFRWAEADMRAFDLGRDFDLAIIPGHSFQFMLSIADQLSCLGCVRRHLVPGGALVVHVNHDDLSWLSAVSAAQPPGPDPPAEVRLPDGRLYNVARQWAYDPATQTASVTTRYVEIEPGGAIGAPAVRGPVRLHCFFPFELDHLFRRAGFRVEARYGDFVPSEFTARSPEMIWVARSSRSLRRGRERGEAIRD